MSETTDGFVEREHPFAPSKAELAGQRLRRAQARYDEKNSVPIYIYIDQLMSDREVSSAAQTYMRLRSGSHAKVIISQITNELREHFRVPRLAELPIVAVGGVNAVGQPSSEIPRVWSGLDQGQINEWLNWYMPELLGPNTPGFFINPEPDPVRKKLDENDLKIVIYGPENPTRKQAFAMMQAESDLAWEGSMTFDVTTEVFTPEVAGELGLSAERTLPIIVVEAPSDAVPSAFQAEFPIIVNANRRAAVAKLLENLPILWAAKQSVTVQPASLSEKVDAAARELKNAAQELNWSQRLYKAGIVRDTNERLQPGSMKHLVLKSTEDLKDKAFLASMKVRYSRAIYEQTLIDPEISPMNVQFSPVSQEVPEVTPLRKKAVGTVPVMGADTANIQSGMV